MTNESINKIAGEVPHSCYGVLHVEGMTGIILDVDGKRSMSKPLQYLIFPTLDEALRYSKVKVTESPDIDCNIYDSRQSQVEVVRNDEYIAALLSAARAKRQKKAWWKWW